MTKRRVIIEPGAKTDILEAFDHYRQVADVHVARRYRDEVRAGIRTISEAPERWPLFDEDGARRYLLKVFPYGILYEVDDETIIVLAVMHLRRGAGYWAEND